jgi:hypothetical protein
MRDPFANYDSWLERPYQDAYDAQDRQEYIDEHSEYTTDCCGEDVGYEDGYDIHEAKGEIKCPKCGEMAHVNKSEPDLEPDEPEYDPDDFRDDDYFDRG